MSFVYVEDLVAGTLAAARSDATRSKGYFLCARTTSRLRPFARRRLRTLRPAAVALRLRNPCSRFRRILLGWYVRFTTTASNGKKRGNQARRPPKSKINREDAECFS